MNEQAKKIDEVLENIYRDYRDENVGTPYLDEILLEKMGSEFPGSHLALLKAYDGAHKYFGHWDESARNFIAEFDYQKTCSFDKDFMKLQFKMDKYQVDRQEEFLQQTKDMLDLYRQTIEDLKKEESVNPESRINKLLHPLKNRTARIKEFEGFARMEVEQLRKPLFPEYEESRDRLLDWDLKYGVSDLESLSAKLTEFENYVVENNCLYYAVDSIINDKRPQINELCDIASHAAWDGTGPYGKAGDSLSLFDLTSPDSQLLITGEVYEQSYEDFTARSVIQYNGKIISQEEAQRIVDDFEQPCVYTSSDYRLFIENSEDKSTVVQLDNTKVTNVEEQGWRQEKFLESAISEIELGNDIEHEFAMADYADIKALELENAPGGDRNPIKEYTKDYKTMSQENQPGIER